jgi:hypothetical protein
MTRICQLKTVILNVITNAEGGLVKTFIGQLKCVENLEKTSIGAYVILSEHLALGDDTNMLLRLSDSLTSGRLWF